MTAMVKRIGHFIGGALQSVPEAEVNQITNPWTERVAYDVEQATPELLETILDTAFASFKANRSAPAHQRAEWLRGAAESIVENRDKLADLLIETIGKPRKAAL